MGPIRKCPFPVAFARTFLRSISCRKIRLCRWFFSSGFGSPGIVDARVAREKARAEPATDGFVGALQGRVEPATEFEMSS